MGHDVFVSHSAKDKPTADAVCAVLEGQGIRCWVAPRDIIPGKDWGESIVDAIKGARVMVLVFSTHANVSPQIKREVERAVHKGIPVIPLRIEAIEPTASLEYFLSTPHWLDAFTPPLEKHLQYLAQVVRSITAGAPEPGSVPSGAGNKQDAAKAINAAPATKTPQPVSSFPSPAAEKRKFSLLVMTVVALTLACFAGWYLYVYEPGQKHQAELAQLHAAAAKAAADKQAADAKAQADAAAAQKAKALAAQQAAEELAAKQAADAKAQANAEAARKAKVLATQQAEELAAKQAADAKAQLDATAARRAAFPATSNQTFLSSSPHATLSKLTLADFNEMFGLKIGATTNEVRALFGAPAMEYTEGGNFHDRDLIWEYRAGGNENLKIGFDNQTKVIHSITFNEDHLPWLAARSMDDPKLSLLGKSDLDIEKLIGPPTQTFTSTLLYQGKGLEVEFLCSEYNYFKCSRIVISWNGQ